MWSAVFFNNVLLLAHDEQDACRKLETFLERCQQHNNVLVRLPVGQVLWVSHHGVQDPYIPERVAELLRSGALLVVLRTELLRNRLRA